MMMMMNGDAEYDEEWWMVFLMVYESAKLQVIERPGRTSPSGSPSRRAGKVAWTRAVHRVST